MKFAVVSFFSSVLILSFSMVFTQTSKYENKIVKKIEFKGLQNVDEGDLNEIIDTTIGYPFKASEIRQDIKDIFKNGSFDSVDVQVDDYADGVLVIFHCKERAIIETIEFYGLDELLETDLLGAIPLKENAVVRKDYIEKSLNIIKTKYDEEGLFNAVVLHKVEVEDKEDNTVKVSFIIDEGEEIKVQKIVILGTKNVYVEELLKVIETEEDGIIDDGSFKSDIFEQDKAKILMFYKKLGYLDVQIIEDRVEYEWIDPSTKEERGIYITLKIDEGERYYFDKYSVKVLPGAEKPVYTSKMIMSQFKLKNRGEIFDDEIFQKDRQMVSFLYANQGYIFSRVVPDKKISEVDVVVDGKTVKRKYVSVSFTVSEGKKAFVDQIIIKGNAKTKDKVIRREIIIKEGELFSSQKMQITRERIFNLGFFKQVNIDVRPGSRDGFMNLIIDVEEQPTGTISLGGGYGTTSGFSIFADIGENNLMGNGQKVNVKFEYGPEKTAVTIGFQERWFMDYPVGFDTSIFYNLYKYEYQSIFTSSNEQSEYQKQSIGYTLGFSYRYWYYYTTGIRWSHAFSSYLNPSGNSPDSIYMSQARGTQQKRTITLYTSRNTKDNYLNPTRGSNIGVSFAFTGGGVLGGDDHFTKIKPEFSYYYSPFHLPFLKSHPVVIEARINAEFTAPPMFTSNINQDATKNAWLEPEDRITIGGPETIRGWDYYDLDFASSWRQVGLFHKILYGFELRIPIHPEMFWLAFFFDAGSLWSDNYWVEHLSDSDKEIVQADIQNGDLKNIGDIGSTNLLKYFKYSYGFGFRVQIPMMPLRFWFAKKMIYDGGFKVISDYTFQFGIGDMRF